MVPKISLIPIRWVAALSGLVECGPSSRDETKKCNYHNRTIQGSMRVAQTYLTKKLRERDLGRDLEGAKITLNEYLDRWLEIDVKPRAPG